MSDTTEKGVYIVLEALQKAGKTTQARLLHKDLVERFPNRKVLYTREPGGTEIADAIRELVQGTSFREEMEPVCEALLYAAARAQSLKKLVRPAIDLGMIVVADRSVDSSTVIQGHVRGLGPAIIEHINYFATAVCKPDRRYFIDVDPETCFARAQNDHDPGDKFEIMPLEFFQKSRQGYRDLLRTADGNMERIPGDGSIQEVHGLLLNAVLKLINGN